MAEVTKTQRPLDEIVKDLSNLASDIAAKKKAVEEAKIAHYKATNELDEARTRGALLRAEMQEYLDMFLPDAMQGRVRQS